MRRALLAAAAFLAALAAAATAGATNECRGLQVCVPVAGPWVVTPGTAAVEYQLACPRRYVVGGFDAELSARGIDVGFRGALGSPVNPGVTTSTSALFSARLPAGGGPASFRPHIGCIPASGGGQRFPTAYRAFPPAKPLAPTAVQHTVLPGVHRYADRCPRTQRLVSATHAVGFYTQAPPRPAVIRTVTVVQAVRHGRVQLTVRASGLPPNVLAVVQADLLCVGTV